MFNVRLSETGESISEKDAIIMIKKGTPLDSFDPVTDLMAIAAVKANPKNWEKVPNYAITPRVARNMVLGDFHAYEILPDDIKSRCHKEFAKNAVRVTRQTKDDYERILKQESDTFIRKIAKEGDRTKRFVGDERRERMFPYGDADRGTQTSDFKSGTTMPKHQASDFVFQFMDDEEYSTILEDSPASFLLLSNQNKSLDHLIELLNTDAIFPADFIKQLLIPNRNHAFYEKNGKAEAAETWKKEIIPWVNKEVILRIAEIHPEASIATPKYLTKEGVHNFFLTHCETMSSAELASFYLKFPPELLSEEDACLVDPDWRILRHTPEILVGTDYAVAYLKRHPAEVLRLPEVYQTREFVLADGVPLNPGGIAQIKNEELRELVLLALTRNAGLEKTDEA